MRKILFILLICSLLLACSDSGGYHWRAKNISTNTIAVITVSKRGYKSYDTIGMGIEKWILLDSVNQRAQ